MAKITVYDINNKKVGDKDLPEELFNSDVKPFVVHQVINAQLAKRRSGNACTKTRSDVRGGGKKPYKQKGTGNARRGSQRSPLIVGGGVIHGPKPRSYEQKVPKKLARAAMISALSDKFKSERIILIKDFKMDAKKTKNAAEMAKKFGWNKALLVTDDIENLGLSFRNIPGFTVMKPQGVNTYDLVKHEWLVMGDEAADAVSERFKG